MALLDSHFDEIRLFLVISLTEFHNVMHRAVSPASKRPNNVRYLSCFNRYEMRVNFCKEVHRVLVVFHHFRLLDFRQL